MSNHKDTRTGLVVIETHPIQYHAPVYRHIAQKLGIPVTVVYGSDFSISGYRDIEFGSDFAWDTDLLSGYKAVFLSRSSEGGAQNAQEVKTRGLHAVLERLKPDAILCVGYSPTFHWKAFRIARRTGKPILFRGETTDHARRRSQLKEFARDFALRRLYQQCSAIMFVGALSKEHFRRLGVNDETLFFSPYCVDGTSFQFDELARTRLRESTRSELGVDPDETVIAFSGKLSPRKAPDQLLRAVRELGRDSRKQCVVLFIGDGQLRHGLEELAHVQPPVRIKQVGFQNQSNLSRFYHASDLLALPSLELETWGLVVNEALLHGVPVVVSDAVGCGPDLVIPGRTGEIFRAGSIPDFAAALFRSLTLAGSPAIRRQCRAVVHSYSVERAALGIAVAYERVTQN